jgi:hypothetical protein
MASVTPQTTCATVQTVTACAGSNVQLTARELRDLQKDLLHAISATHDNLSMLTALGRIINEALSPLAIHYLGRTEGGELESTWQFTPGGGSKLPEEVLAEIHRCCDQACAKGRLDVAEIGAEGGGLTVAAPVFQRRAVPEALAVLVPMSQRSLERIVLVLELAASHVTLWHVLGESAASQRNAEATAVLVELLAKLVACDDLRQGCYTLVSALQEHLGWDDVAVGMCRRDDGPCRLAALAGHAQFDRHCSRTRAFEAVFDEAILRGTLATWPAADAAPRHSTRALEHLSSITGAVTAVAGPIDDDHGKSVGAWVFLDGKDPQDRDAAHELIRAAAAPVAAGLLTLRRAERGRLARLTRKLVEKRRTWQLKVGLLAACVLAAALAMPLPYKVKCDCEIEPVTRRFVVAPFDGRLEKALVAPGDVPHRNDVLARIDGRDIRWELASLNAEHGREAKRRDAAMASHDIVTAQLARLEMERIHAKMAMFEDRIQHLDIRSPIDGIVISGDQERTEGAPLKIGQALFEIAPLDKMIVAVAIPEEDINYVRTGLPVTVRCDAFPRREWRGTISKLHPRSETWEDQNVFIAEVPLDNSEDLLRPGMKGRAKVVADRRPLAWNLFHKPWEHLLSLAGW